MYQEFTKSRTGANNKCPMESRDHFKNGVSPKNQRSRGKSKIMRNSLLLFVATMLFSITSAFAEGGTTGPLTWNLNSGTLTITVTSGGTGAMPDYNLMYANPPWYDYRLSINTIDIKNGVTKIGDNAFVDCQILTTLNIGDNVITIGSSAFFNCYSLKDLTIPASVNEIHNAAFNNCSSLTEVTIVQSQIALDFSTASFIANFYGSDNIKKIYLGRNITYYVNLMGSASPFKGKALLSDLTIEKGVTEIGNGLFDGCKSLPKVIIPNSVNQAIGECAFKDCESLKTLIIGSNVPAIGSYAFYNCHSLTTLTIPASVNKIESRAFDGCSSLTDVTIDQSQIALDFSVVAYGANFYGSENIKKIDLGRNITYYDSASPFKGKALLSDLTIEKGVTEIGNSLFEDCISLPEVTIPNSVNTIDDNAFSGCQNLLTLTIGSGVQTIGNNAFSGCKKLQKILSYPCNPPTIQSNTFSSVNTNIPVHIDCDCLKNYKGKDYWNDFTNWRRIDDGSPCITSITEVSEASDLIIHPNPTTGELIINNEQLSMNNAEYIIFNLTGQMVMQGKLQGETTTINVASLPSGMYYLRIAGKAVKFVKM